MTAAIPGHGYHPLVMVTPRCTCGWQGGVAESDGNARDQYEAHKRQHRRPLTRREIRYLSVVKT